MRATSIALPTELAPIAPNPSALPLQLGYTLSRAGRVRIALFDVQGRQVAVLEQGERAGGRHRNAWAGGDLRGGLPAGVYIVQLSAADRTVHRRVAVVR